MLAEARCLDLATALTDSSMGTDGASFGDSPLSRGNRILRFQDMGLMLVLGGAVVVTFLAYRFVPKLLRQPLLGGAFGAHESVMDRSTIIGAAIFGIGWGLGGYCPGPALVTAAGGGQALLFVAAMLVGMAVEEQVARRRALAQQSCVGDG
jgi:uncharacterized membrane protein YedE/YeeE